MGFPRVAEIFLSSAYLDDGAIAQVQNGDGGEYAHYVLSPTARCSSPPSKTRSSKWQALRTALYLRCRVRKR